MEFDVAGARKAGYSEGEIASYLAEKHDFDLEGAKKAGYSDGDVIGHLTATPKASDFAKSAASGALSGTGMIFQGGGELLARGVNAVAGTELRSENPFKSAIEWLEQSKSTGAKRAEAGSQISGSLFDPSTYDFGTNPTVAGLALQGMNAIGQFMPNLAIALGTAGASVPTQLAIGATVGGIQALGGALDEERQQINGMSHEDLLAGSRLYKDFIDKGVPQDVAKNAVAEAAAMGGGLGNAFPSAAEGAFENFLIGALTRGRLKIPGKGILGKTAVGVAGGAATGGTEEALEQMGQNIGSNIAIGGNRPVTQDTLQQFVMGAIAEGAAGGGGGAATGLLSSKPVQPQPATEEQPAGAPLALAAPVVTDAGVSTETQQTQQAAIDQADRNAASLEQARQAEEARAQEAFKKLGLARTTDEAIALAMEAADPAHLNDVMHSTVLHTGLLDSMEPVELATPREGEFALAKGEVEEQKQRELDAMVNQQRDEKAALATDESVQREQDGQPQTAMQAAFAKLVLKRMEAAEGARTPADVRVLGKPVGEMTDEELAHAAENHRMSGFRESARAEMVRRRVAIQQQGGTNATAVRGDQGQAAEAGQAQEASGANRGGNVQLAAAGGSNANGTELRAAGEGQGAPAQQGAEVTPHDYTSTQVALPPVMAEQVKSAAKRIIKPEDVHPEEGLEDRPHITVKYGLHTENAADVQKVLAGEPPVKAKIDGIDVFKPEDKDYEVVVARVDSPDLVRLNAKIKDALPNTETFPTYKPHVTLGYVKKGAGDKYASAKTGLEGKEITLDTVEFAGRDESVTPIKLEGAQPPAVRQQLFVERGNQRIEVASLEDAARKWGQFFHAAVREGAGAESVSGARVVDQNGTEVARISQNGRVWPPGEWKSGQKPLVEAIHHTPETKGSVKDITAEATKPLTFMGKPLAELNAKALQTASKSARSKAIREAASAELERRHGETHLEVPPDMHEPLRKMAESAVWFEEGGKAAGGQYIPGVTRKSQQELNEAGEGRTQWVGMPDWARGFGMNKADFQAAVEKAIAGQPLGKKQRQAVQAMMDEVKEYRAFKAEMDAQGVPAEEQAVAEQVLADSQAPDDWNKMSHDDQEAYLDSLFGPAKAGAQDQARAEEAPPAEVRPAGRQPGEDDDLASRPALELSSPTEQDLKAKEAQATAGSVEEQHAAVRDRNEAILTPPVGTAPPRSAEEQRVPTSQTNLFTTAASALREAAEKIERAAAPEKPGNNPVNTGTKLTDVGENLWANRRNFTKNAIGWDDVKGLNDALKVKEVVKPKVWPKPDYEGLVEQGMQPFIARMLKQVYDGISTAPAGKSDEDLQTYIKAVGKVRDAVFAWAKDANANRDFLTRIADQAKAMQARRSYIISSLGDQAGIRDVILDRAWPKAENERSRFPSDSEALAEIRAIGANRAIKAFQFSMDDAVDAMKDVTEGWPKPQESWQRQGIQVVERAPSLTVREQPQPGGRDSVWVVEINGRYIQSSKTPITAENVFPPEAKWLVINKRRDVVGWSETEDKAKEIARELVKRETKGGDIRGMNISQAERSGPERRKEGENITPQRLMDEFGLRGVNFGREGWINQNERQAYLNHAYDALLDLAEIMDVPPKALSLNGMLGIAFGAQGSRWHGGRPLRSGSQRDQPHEDDGRRHARARVGPRARPLLRHAGWLREVFRAVSVATRDHRRPEGRAGRSQAGDPRGVQ
jgi:2'-5' RNA ligase